MGAPFTNSMADLTDDDLGDIMVAKLVRGLLSQADLAERFDVELQVIELIRQRRTKRAIRVAIRLGLIAPIPPMTARWSGRAPKTARQLMREANR